MSDKPQTFAERIAEARERILNGADDRVPEDIFDATVETVLKPEIAEKDAEIARLRARVQELEADNCVCWRDENPLAESRMVTDAQRTKMLAALEACVRHHADAPCSAACAASVWDEWRAAIMCMPVEQPAGEGAS